MTSPDTWTYFQWLLSAATVVFTVLAGAKHRSTWLFAICVQLLWSIYIVATKQWGLLPMNVVLWVLYIRNAILWRHDGQFIEASISQRRQFNAFKSKAAPRKHQ